LFSFGLNLKNKHKNINFDNLYDKVSQLSIFKLFDEFRLDFYSDNWPVYDNNKINLNYFKKYLLKNSNYSV
jgi:hypothetical protein